MELAEADWRVAWNGEKQLAIPELGGTLAFRQRKGRKEKKEDKAATGEEGAGISQMGISLEKVSAQPVSIRPRRGGERLRPDCKRPRRSLKNLLREASLPPWERMLPLMFSGEHLVWVPGIGVDCDFQAREGEPDLTLEWVAERRQAD